MVSRSLVKRVAFFFYLATNLSFRCEWRSGIDQALIPCAARWIQTCASPTPNHTESDSRLILTIRLEGEARARDRGRRREKWKLRRSAPRIHAASSTEKMQRLGEGGALTCWLATWWAKRRPAEQTNASARFQLSRQQSPIRRSTLLWSLHRATVPGHDSVDRSSDLANRRLPAVRGVGADERRLAVISE